MLKNTKVEGIYASVISDGSIRVKVEENTPGAKLREGELRDGSKYSKWELVYNELYGHITNIAFFEGDYGKNIQVSIKAEGDDMPVILSLSCGGSFGEDFMKKLPSVNLSLPITIKPYSFTDDAGKQKKGVTIEQEGKKLPSFFTKKEGDKNVLTNGMPQPSEKMAKTDWKIYFMQVGKFLEEYTENNIITKFAANDLITGVEEVKTEDINF